MMLKTLPFNALRTLESVVRLSGFGRAAEELNVTQSAVSQHVKLLEEWLGHKLLIRHGRHTSATEAGLRLARATRDGFGGIELICGELRGAQKGNEVGIHVAAPPGFAFIWLLPRLLHFDEKYPDIPVSLSTDPVSRDPMSSKADLIISYSAGGFPGLHAEHLMAEEMSPVCRPDIAHTLKSVDDLADHVILEDSLDRPGLPSNWEFWGRETNSVLPKFARTQKHGQANLVIQAAIIGRGVAMGRCPLVADALRDGTLVHPFPETAKSQSSYWLVCRHEALDMPPVTAFRNWLHQEVAPLPDTHWD